MSLIEDDCVPGGTRKNLETADKDVQWNGASQAIKFLLADAQTSGGLLLCVPQDNRQEVLDRLNEQEVPVVAEVGRLNSSVESTPPILVCDS